MDREEGIRTIAYHIWEEEGCCHGRHAEHWLTAETIWLDRNKPARTVTEIQSSARNQQFNTAGKSNSAPLVSTQKSKRGKSSIRNP